MTTIAQAVEKAVKYAAPKAASGDIEGLLANVRVNPDDGLHHAVLADALDEDLGEHPIHQAIRKFGQVDQAASQNLWHDFFGNSYDGSFPGEVHVGDHGPFRLLLGREGSSGYKDHRWHVRVIPWRVRNRQLRDLAYTIELPHGEAAAFADAIHSPRMKSFVTSGDASEVASSGLSQERLAGNAFDHAARDAEYGRTPGQPRERLSRAVAKVVKYAAHPADLETWHRTLRPSFPVADADREDLPRLAFADWLEENGHPAYGEVVRRHVRTASEWEAEGPHRTAPRTYTDSVYSTATDQPEGKLSGRLRRGVFDNWQVMVGYRIRHQDDKPGATPRPEWVFHHASGPAADMHALVQRLRDEGVEFPGAERPSQDLYNSDRRSLLELLASDAAPRPKTYARPVRYSAGDTATPEARDALLALVRSGRHDLGPVLADALEERNEHHDPHTLQLLRSGHTPVYLHGRGGKWAARAWPRMTLTDIRRKNDEWASRRGHEGWFSRGNMRMFGTRLERRIHQGPGGSYFVHSGDSVDRSHRRWLVAHVNPESGEVSAFVPSATATPQNVISLTRDFGSREAAHEAAAHLAVHGRLPAPPAERLSRRGKKARYAASDDPHTHALLARAIAATPTDHLPSLVYADWLDEHGEPTHAHLVRLAVHTATRPDANPVTVEHTFRTLPAWLGHPQVQFYRRAAIYNYPPPKNLVEVGVVVRARHPQGMDAPVFYHGHSTPPAEAHRLVAGMVDDKVPFAVDARMVLEHMHPPAQHEKMSRRRYARPRLIRSVRDLATAAAGVRPASAFPKDPGGGTQPLDKVDVAAADRLLIHPSLLFEKTMRDRTPVGRIGFDHAGADDARVRYWMDRIAAGERPAVLLGGGPSERWPDDAFHILDGNHRTTAYRVLGVPAVPVILTDIAHRNLSRLRTRPKRYARQVPMYLADSLHPELRHTRLGAILRQVASSDNAADTEGELDPVIALARHAIDAAGPHDKPMDLLPLGILRDYLVENPHHPLARRFNWDHLPEKVALDRTVASHRRPHVLGPFAHILTPNTFGSGVGHNAILSIKDAHPWASVEDIQQSARRVQAQDNNDLGTSPYPGDYPNGIYHEFGFENAEEYHDHLDWNHERVHRGDASHPERYTRPQVSGVMNALRLLRSQNQAQTRAVAAQVFSSLGLQPATVRNAVTTGPAPIAAVLASIDHGGEEEKGEAAAAYLGHLLQLPSVTAFHTDAAGPDSLHSFPLKMAPDAAAKHLAHAGISRAALSPQGTGTAVVVHDPGGQWTQRVLRAAAGAPLKTLRGRSVSFGHSPGHKADAGARKTYREVMDAWEGASRGGDAPAKMSRRGGPVRYAAGGDPAQHAAFHAAIHAASRDALPHLVYADWLEDNGRPAHAEIIRRHIKMSMDWFGRPGGVLLPPPLRIAARPGVTHEALLDRVGKNEYLVGVRAARQKPRGGSHSVLQHSASVSPEDAHRLMRGLEDEGVPRAARWRREIERLHPELAIPGRFSRRRFARGPRFVPDDVPPALAAAQRYTPPLGIILPHRTTSSAPPAVVDLSAHRRLHDLLGLWGHDRDAPAMRALNSAEAHRSHFALHPQTGDLVAWPKADRWDETIGSPDAFRRLLAGLRGQRLPAGEVEHVAHGPRGLFVVRPYIDHRRRVVRGYEAGTGREVSPGEWRPLVLPEYADAVEVANTEAFGRPDVVPLALPPARENPRRMARLPQGGVRSAELRPWAAAIAASPTDRNVTGPFADWLEERGYQHDDLTLHLLRSHDGPLFVVRHPRSGKVVAGAGERVTDDNQIYRLHRRHPDPEVRAAAGSLAWHNSPHREIIHGPHGIVRLHPARFTTFATSDDPLDPEMGGTILRYYENDGTPVATHAMSHVTYHPNRAAARRIALRHAFGV